MFVNLIFKGAMRWTYGKWADVLKRPDANTMARLARRLWIPAVR